MENPIIEVDLQGPDGNIFALLVKARAAIVAAVPRGGNSTQRRLKREAAKFEADKMIKAVMQTHSYNEALGEIQKYVTIQTKGGEPMR